MVTLMRRKASKGDELLKRPDPSSGSSSAAPASRQKWGIHDTSDDHLLTPLFEKKAARGWATGDREASNRSSLPNVTER